MLKKIIHQIIIGPQKNTLITKCIKSWEKVLLHDFEIRVWNKENISSFLEEHYLFALPAFQNARNYGEASDIARYLIVFHFGGYYVDWDIQLNNIDEFIELHDACPSGLLLIDTENYTISSEFFSGILHERYLFELTKDIVGTYDRDERDLMYTPQYSGPYRMRASFRRHPISFQSIVPVKEVFEYDYSEIRSAINFGKNGVMTHYWTHSWIKG